MPTTLAPDSERIRNSPIIFPAAGEPAPIGIVRSSGITQELGHGPVRFGMKRVGRTGQCVTQGNLRLRVEANRGASQKNSARDQDQDKHEKNVARRQDRRAQQKNEKQKRAAAHGQDGIAQDGPEDLRLFAGGRTGYAHFGEQHGQRLQFSEHRDENRKTDQHRQQPKQSFHGIFAARQLQRGKKSLLLDKRRRQKNRDHEHHVQSDLPRQFPDQMEGDVLPAGLSEIADPTCIEIEIRLKERGRLSIEQVHQLIGAS